MPKILETNAKGITEPKYHFFLNLVRSLILYSYTLKNLIWNDDNIAYKNLRVKISIGFVAFFI